VETILSVLIGGAITWFVAWWYYKRAGDELRQEAKLLHAATNAVICLLKNPDAATEIQYDSRGRVSGIIVSASVHA